MGELFIVILHPSYFTHGMTYQSRNYENNIYTNHKVNDILTILCLIRIIPTLKLLISISDYYTNRSHHLCQIHGFESNFLFVVKSLTKQSPFSVICITLFISIILFAYAVRICERPLTDILNDQNFGHLTGAIWNVVATMTTVGYGDYFPRTIPGRVLVFFLCLWGVFMISLMVVTLTNWVTLTNLETKAMNMYLKLDCAQELESKAACVIANLFRFRLKLFEQGCYQSWLADKALNNLKQSMEEFKDCKNRLKAINTSSANQDDIINFVTHLHSDIYSYKKGQQQLMEFNNKLIEKFKNME